MRFFTDIKGRSFPVSRVKKVYEPRKLPDSKVDTVRVDLDEDDAVEVYPSDAKTITEGPIQFIPADAGTFFLYAGDSADDEVHRTTVIGWALCADGNVRAVTPDGPDDGGVINADTILLPNGRVHRYEEEHASEAAWLAAKFKS